MLTNSVLIDRWIAEVNSRLASVYDWSGRNQGRSVLHEACDYVSGSGGKRLRALLALSVAHDLSKDSESITKTALSPAVALELLHAASLVHDDLPALDNDDERRGRPSCHRAFSEATAILTGDALVGAALMLVTTDSELSSDNQARVARTLSMAWWDLCLGQQLDIDLKNNTSAAKRDEMIELKTGALFGASVGCGAICAGIREAVLGDFIGWGSRVGECFQAFDDLDDGDRPESDRGEIDRQRESIVKDAAKLDSRLLAGVTGDVLKLILPETKICQHTLAQSPSTSS